MHADDEFHPPTSDDPFWSETCWFAFSVPERRLSGWFYPFFRPNLGVCSAAVFLWDDHGDQPWNCRYFKQFWHLPMPEGPLSDCRIANGIRYKALESGKVYELSYRDPDGDELAIDLTFTAVMDALSTKSSGPDGGHLDQLGKFHGTIVLDGETIAVDSYGARPIVGKPIAVRAQLDVVGELPGDRDALQPRHVRHPFVPDHHRQRHRRLPADHGLPDLRR